MSRPGGGFDGRPRSGTEGRLARRLARWHTSLARALNDFLRLGVLKEEGHARWGITEKGFAVAREFQLVNNDGVLIDRSLLRKRLDEFAVEFEKMYRVVSRPSAYMPASGE